MTTTTTKRWERLRPWHGVLLLLIAAVAASALIFIPSKSAYAITNVVTIIHDDADDNDGVPTETDYTSIYTAVNELQDNETLRLNTGLYVVLNFDRELHNVTIDLNYYYLLAYPNDDYQYTIGFWTGANNSSFTIKNGGITVGNTNANGVMALSVNGNVKNLTLTLENVIVRTDKLTSAGWVENASVNSDGNPCAYGIYFAGNGNYTIDGGSVKATATAVEFRNGSLTVKNNPTLKTTATSFYYGPNSGGLTTNGAALAVSPHTPATGDMSVTIESGTFIGACAFADINPNENTNVTVYPTIEDGTFNGPIVTYHDGYVTGGTFINDEGTAPQAKIATSSLAKSDTSEVYYFDINNAIEDAAGGSTVTVVKDTAATINVGSECDGKTVTIDLDGHTITPAADATSVVNITASDATVIIKNGSIEVDSDSCATAVTDSATASNVNITLEDVNISVADDTTTAENSAAVAKTTTGTLTITNSTLSGLDNGVTLSQGSASISGSTVSGQENGVVVSDGTASISSSTVSGQENGVVVNEGTASIKDSTITNAATETGAALKVVPTSTNSVNVTVENTTLQSPGAALYDADDNETNNQNVSISINGSTLTGDVVANAAKGNVTESTITTNDGKIPEGLLAEGQTQIPYKNEDGSITYVTYTVYEGDLFVNGHLENYGDRAAEATTQGSSILGTTGQGLRLEGVSLILTSEVNGGITYRAHVQNEGWQPWASDGELAGTFGQGLRMEAIQIELTGDAAQQYNVFYRVHVENYGWLDWAWNGESAGTQGLGLRIEAIEVLLVPFYEDGPATSDATPAFIGNVVTGTATVDTLGTQTSGGVVGTTGQGLKLTSLAFTLANAPYEGSISYQLHVENDGWLAAASDGAVAGNLIDNARIEAITVSLSGELANYYRLEYRTHVENQGWGVWTAEGDVSGTTGQGLRLEAIEFRLVNVRDSLNPGAGAIEIPDDSTASAADSAEKNTEAAAPSEAPAENSSEAGTGQEAA